MAIASPLFGDSYLLGPAPEFDSSDLWLLSSDPASGLSLIASDRAGEVPLRALPSGSPLVVLADGILLSETESGWYSLSVERSSNRAVPRVWTHRWPAARAAEHTIPVVGQGTWNLGDELRVFSRPATFPDDVLRSEAPRTANADLSADLVLADGARAALLTGAHRIAYEASTQSWRFDRLAPEGHTEVAPTNFAHTVAAPSCVPPATPTQVLVGDKRVLGVWEDGTMALAGAGDCLTSAFENPRAAVRATAFTHSGRHIAALSTDDRLTLFAQRLQEGSQ
jgi:hypothetical protein